MYLSVSKIDVNQIYSELIAVRLEETDGAFNIENCKFAFGKDKYILSGQFLNETKKGCLIIAKNELVVARMLTTLDPTLLVTVLADENYWIEINISM